ncbi:bisanhydrobacterioruberin hydratase [Haloferax larsenii]|uniref:Putative membrane protein n=1 Tax=Haloferax larsenii TaxID=302484 RepID=A0A1H7U0J0_HALLR|nr:bisanhydrobacterioruberin hydratase [Haloferax larsenii]SEL90453.1 putative membrane protein [Haloferax larsenii]
MGEYRPRLPRTRREVEHALDRLVRENRFTISVFFPLNGAVLLVASAMGWLPEPLVFNAFLILLGTLVMRSPLIVGVLPLVTRPAALGIGALTAYAYAIEYTGITTGWPYGWFEYGVELGPTVAGVPIGLPVFFIPLVMNAYLLCLLLLGDRARHTATRLGVVIATVLAMDVVLDPGAVALGFWEYYRLGPDALLFYGVPLSNYAGWVVSATIAVVLLDWGFDRDALLARLDRTEFMLDDLVSFVILWGGINLWFGNVVPVLVAGLFGIGLLRTERFDSQLFKLPRSLPWQS